MKSLFFYILLFSSLITKKSIVLKNPEQVNDLIPSNIFAEYLEYIITKSKFNSSIVKISYKKNKLLFFAKLIEKRTKKLLNLNSNLKIIKNKKFTKINNQKIKNNANKVKFILKKNFNKNNFLKEIDKKIVYINKIINF